MTAESRPPLRKAPQSGLFMGVPVNRRGRCNFYAIKFFLYNKFLIFTVMTGAACRRGMRIPFWRQAAFCLFLIQNNGRIFA